MQEKDDFCELFFAFVQSFASDLPFFLKTGLTSLHLCILSNYL